MNENERILAICNHPSKLFPLPEWVGPIGLSGEMRCRLSRSGPYWLREVWMEAWCYSALLGDHEAHCLVECGLRETLAGMGPPRWREDSLNFNDLLSAAEAVLRELNAKQKEREP